MKQTQNIAIVGGSASGKSRLAESVCAELSGRASCLCLDEFYRDLSHLGKSERAKVNFDDPAAIDWDCVRGALAGLTQGQTIKLPVYDFVTHTRLKTWRAFVATPLVIWDGLWLMHPDWLRGAFRHSIFVDCSPEERLRRRLERDVSERGRSPESVREQFFRQVQPMHEEFVEPQKKWADHIVSSPVDAEKIRELAKMLLKICEDGGTRA